MSARTVSYNSIVYRAFELAGRTRDKIPISEQIMMKGFLTVDLQGIWNKAEWPELIPDFINVGVTDRTFSKRVELGEEALGATVSTDGTALAVVTTSEAHNMASGDTFTIDDALLPQFNVTDAVATVTDATHFTFVIPPSGAASASVCTVHVNTEIGDILGIYSTNPRATTRWRVITFQEGNGVVYIDDPAASVWVEFVQPMIDLSALTSLELSGVNILQRFSNYLACRGAGHLLRSDSQFASGDEMLALAESALTAELNRLPPPPPWRGVRVRSSFGRARVNAAGQIA